MKQRSPRGLSPAFVQELCKGRLLPLLNKIRTDADLTLVINEDAIDVLYMGVPLLTLRSDMRYTIDSVLTHKIAGKVTKKFDSLRDCTAFVEKELPIIKDKVNSDTSHRLSLEIEYQRLLVRANNHTSHIGNEFFFVDWKRPFSTQDRDERPEFLGVFIDRKKRDGHVLTVEPFFAAIHHAIASDLTEFPARLKRHHDSVRSQYDVFIDEMQTMLQQRAELGLFDVEEELSAKLQIALIDRHTSRLRILVLFIDYPPYDTQVEETIAVLGTLTFARHISVLQTGLALWKETPLPLL